MIYALNVFALAVSVCAVLFLTYAVALSSRPKFAIRRGIEFGVYTFALALMTLLNVPAASGVVGPEATQDPTIWTALKTLIFAIIPVRVGLLALRWYGVRIALEKHVKQLKAQKGE